MVAIHLGFGAFQTLDLDVAYDPSDSTALLMVITQSQAPEGKIESAFVFHGSRL